jgi:hypothetical protein
MAIIKMALITALIMVFIQDGKDREVYGFLFPIIGLSSGILLYTNMMSQLFYLTLVINLLFVVILLAVVFF